ncbi:MAG: helix-turn-helix transcriptional regulator [Polyangiaceae bacterium]
MSPRQSRQGSSRAKPAAKSRDSEKQRRLLREIGTRVREARVAAALTQEEAAARAAIDSKRWQRIEYGQVNPTATTLLRVAEAVETDLWGLLRTKKKTPPSKR